MKKYEILYDWPCAEITRLADSEEAEAYADTLSEPLQSRFVDLTEKMRVRGQDLVAAKAKRQHFLQWEELCEFVEELGNQFASFSGPSVERLKVSLLFADKLAQSNPALDEDEIDENTFELRELINPVPLSWFCRQNGHSFMDSVAVFSCTDHRSVASALTDSPVSPELLFHLMAALQHVAAFPTTQAVLVKKTNPEVDANALNAFVHLSVLATGKPVHSAYRYTNPPVVLDPDEIRPGAPYQQWAEVLNVISEYNSRDEILLKYLTIYHVVENFMFRRPIVELERQNNGVMFSIRDFKRLYDRVEMKEPEALRQLFAAVFLITTSASNTFNQQIVNRWNALVPTVTTAADIDAALHSLGVNFTFNEFGVQQGVDARYSKLVYAFRNAIVHNKETEFHLTYATLSTVLCSLIEQFLLPSLEEICFLLVSRQNNLLWYQNSELRLYA